MVALVALQVPLHSCIHIHHDHPRSCNGPDHRLDRPDCTGHVLLYIYPPVCRDTLTHLCISYERKHWKYGCSDCEYKESSAK